MTNSIHLHPEGHAPLDKGAIALVLRPRLEQHYLRRSQRLQHLAEGHGLSEYLMFLAGCVQAQQQVLQQLPLPAHLQAVAQQRLDSPGVVLDASALPRDGYWRQLLDALLERLPEQVPEAVQQVAERLRQADTQQREGRAAALLRGELAAVDSGEALFIWQALSLYWTQMAAALPLQACADASGHRQFCPVCNSMPVASVLLGDGLRYLHCSLCESRWHQVRSTCSNCEQTGRLDYWSLAHEQDPIKAESCDDCQSYLKRLDAGKLPGMDVLADDLASLALDAQMERQGYARSAFNPLLFPG